MEIRELANALQLPIRSGFIKRGKHFFRPTPRAKDTLRGLATIWQRLLASRTKTCLIPMRDLIRLMDTSACSATLNFVIRRTRLGGLRLLAIWLRGRRGGSNGLERIERFSDYPDARVRKEVARAMRRMSGWAPLRRMIHNERLRDDCDPRVLSLARERTSRPRRRNLTELLDSFRSGEYSDQSMRLFVDPEIRHGLTENTQGALPKSDSMIRQILMRIRSLIRRSPFAEQT